MFFTQPIPSLFFISPFIWHTMLFPSLDLFTHPHGTFLLSLFLQLLWNMYWSLRFETSNCRWENKWYLTFWIWVTSLNLIFSTSINLSIYLQISLFHYPYIWIISHCIKYMYIFIIHSCVKELFLKNSLARVNRVEMSVAKHTSVLYVVCSLGIC